MIELVWVGKKGKSKKKLFIQKTHVHDAMLSETYVHKKIIGNAHTLLPYFAFKERLPKRNVQGAFLLYYFILLERILFG